MEGILDTINRFLGNIKAPVPDEYNMMTPQGKDLANYAADTNQAFGSTPNVIPTPTGGPQIKPQVLAANTSNRGPVFANGTPAVSASPTPTPSPATSQYEQNITIPYSHGGTYKLDPNLAQIIMNSFDKNNEATDAAQVLNHPLDNPYRGAGSGDPASINHNTMGENGSFKENNIDVPNYNKDGSIIMIHNPFTNRAEPSTDRGLFRINNAQFYGMMQNPQTKALLAQKGITSWDDMNDPQKNADTAAIIQNNRGWEPWFAAPHDLRTGQYQYAPNKPLQMHPTQ